MYKIRTYNAISTRGLDRFPRDRYEIASEFSAPDALILRSHKLHGQPVPDSVVAVARAGAGVNNIPIKELVVASLLLGSRDIYGGMNFVQQLGQFSDAAEMARALEKEKKRFAGSEITGKTLGVVGLGAIGAMVANLALELGMDVAGYDPAISVEAAWQLSSRVQRMENLQTLLSHSDFVTIHVPAIDATRHLINRDTLAHMRVHAQLLNFARESIVDTAAVIAALDAGRLGGYITDFPVPELLGRDDALLMPHIGASTAEAEDNCAMMAATQLMDFLEHGNISNSVNFPATRMALVGGTRITFSNKNIPKVLGSVLTILADRDLNIIDMVNRSRADVAYNIIDVEGDCNSDLEAQLAGVDGVIRVRLIHH
jgi:D-3-phosphoglycerate dehydrogenase